MSTYTYPAITRRIGATISYLSGLLFVVGAIFIAFCNPWLSLMTIGQKETPPVDTTTLAGIAEASARAGESFVRVYPADTSMKVLAAMGVLFASWIIVGTLAWPLRMHVAPYLAGLRTAVTSTRPERTGDDVVKTPLQVLALAARVARIAFRGIFTAVVAVATRTPGAIRWIAANAPVAAAAAMRGGKTFAVKTVTVWVPAAIKGSPRAASTVYEKVRDAGLAAHAALLVHVPRFSVAAGRFGFKTAPVFLIRAWPFTLMVIAAYAVAFSTIPDGCATGYSLVDGECVVSATHESM